MPDQFTLLEMKMELKNFSIRLTGKSVSAFFLLFVLTFLFNTCKEDPSVMPELTTLKTADTDITATTAVLKGEVLILGTRNIIEYGIEISKSMIFSPSEIKGYSATPSVGVFEVEFTDLDPGTLYYFKAYVLINTAQVYSRNYENFTTK
jgi:hypothetical protein